MAVGRPTPTSSAWRHPHTSHWKFSHFHPPVVRAAASAAPSATSLGGFPRHGATHRAACRPCPPPTAPARAGSAAAPRFPDGSLLDTQMCSSRRHWLVGIQREFTKLRVPPTGFVAHPPSTRIKPPPPLFFLCGSQRFFSSIPVEGRDGVHGRTALGAAFRATLLEDSRLRWARGRASGPR